MMSREQETAMTDQPDEDDDPRTIARTILAARHADLSAQIVALEEEKKIVREQLLACGPGEAGELRVQITQSKRLNPVRFMTAYPVEEHPDYYKSVPIAAMAKALDDASCYDLDAPTVRVVES